MNKKVLILTIFCFIHLGLSFTMEPMTLEINNLQLVNYTGIKVNSTMINKFVDLIKKSYLYHREDIVESTHYIRAQV